MHYCTGDSQAPVKKPRVNVNGEQDWHDILHSGLSFSILLKRFWRQLASYINAPWMRRKRTSQDSPLPFSWIVEKGFHIKTLLIFQHERKTILFLRNGIYLPRNFNFLFEQPMNGILDTRRNTRSKKTVYSVQSKRYTAH